MAMEMSSPNTQQLSNRSIVLQLIYHPRQRLALFSSLPINRQVQILKRLPLNIQIQLLSQIDKTALLPILEYADPDESTDLLRHLPKNRQAELLAELSQSLQDDISLLLQFDPKTAAGLMSLNYVQVEDDENMAEIAKKIKKHEKRTGKFPLILVLHEGQIKGYLPNYKLAYATAGEAIASYVQPISTMAYTTSSQSVIRHFFDHPHSKVAVLNQDGMILGVLYADDVLRVIRQEEISSLYDFAGVHENETVFDSVKKKVSSRYKWLIINLATAFLASGTVSFFDETIAKYVLLAVYMPIVSGMGGNAATQTLAVLVRGIAMQEIELKTAWPTLKKELGSAFINGIINGILVAAVVLAFNHDPLLAFVLALAMISNLLVAAFAGTLIPLIMHKLGKDPATSATVFITTATDVLGFLSFLGLATLILPH
ncbi:Magnesium transporter MgtE [bioreactor metagenome]|uniref:Magnesium transporter MgtE n=1 Tax=bioreactor metagenome TaxID=1076179 RepID=A0A644ZKZ1_9ZZZZ